MKRKRSCLAKSWNEAHRVQLDAEQSECCALSDSRALVGGRNSDYLELFRVESGPRIARVHRICVNEKYERFAATSGSDTLVAMSYSDNSLRSMRVHRLCGDQMEKLACTQINAHSYRQCAILWLADRLLVGEYNEDTRSDFIAEFEVSGRRLERRRELVAASDRVELNSVCAPDNGLAIFDNCMGDLLLYSFD